MTNRELDIWLARHLMGLTPEVVEDNCRKEYAKSAKHQQGAGMLGTETWDKDCEDWRKEYYRDKEIPYYTESISDAFQVVEKMMKKGYMFALGGERNWSATFHSRKSSFYCDADTPSLAICLAAKKAVEGEG